MKSNNRTDKLKNKMDRRAQLNPAHPAYDGLIEQPDWWTPNLLPGKRASGFNRRRWISEHPTKRKQKHK